mmetsp:Transcript_11052/g.21081  ORF Transcript_11052/g.21081 Transcript_11052/m.21081 type:complete len:213 (-) Transcript_11052:325-963(-)
MQSPRAPSLRRRSVQDHPPIHLRQPRRTERHRRHEADRYRGRGQGSAAERLAGRAPRLLRRRPSPPHLHGQRHTHAGQSHLGGLPGPRVQDSRHSRQRFREAGGDRSRRGRRQVFHEEEPDGHRGRRKRVGVVVGGGRRRFEDGRRRCRRRFRTNWRRSGGRSVGERHHWRRVLRHPVKAYVCGGKEAEEGRQSALIYLEKKHEVKLHTEVS